METSHPVKGSIFLFDGKMDIDGTVLYLVAGTVPPVSNVLC